MFLYILKVLVKVLGLGDGAVQGEEARGQGGAGGWDGCHLGLSVLQAFGKEIPC